MVTVALVVLAMIIAVAVVIPTMIVFSPSVVAYPVAVVEHPPVVSRVNPVSTGVRRTGPIPIVPLVLVLDRIPVPRNPYIRRLGWWWRPHIEDARSTQPANLDPD